MSPDRQALTAYATLARRLEAARRASRASLGAGGLVIAVGLAVLIGWHARISWLTQLYTGFVAMQYSTALAFVLSGAALIALLYERYTLVRVLSGGALLLGGLSLLEHISGRAMGVDAIPWRLGVDQAAMAALAVERLWAPGRMALLSAVSFTLASLAALWLAHPRPSLLRVSLAAGSALLIVMFGVVELAGYALGDPTSPEWGLVSRMALHTAATVCVLGLGLLGAASIAAERAHLPTRRWRAVLAGTGVAALTLVMWEAMIEQDRTSAAGEVREVGQAVVAELEHRADDRVRLLDRIAARWARKTAPDPATWEFDALQTMRDYPAITLLALTDERAKVYWRLPRDSAETELPVGAGAADNALIAHAMRMAVTNGAAQGTPPLATREGGMRTIIAVPVGQRSSRGYLLTGISLSYLASDALRENLTRGYDITLRDGRVVVFASQRAHPADSTRWALAMPLSLFGRHMTLVARPTVEILANDSSVLPTVLLGAGILLAPMVGWIVYARQRSEEESKRLAAITTQLAAENDARRAAEESLMEQRGALERARDFRAALVHSTVDAVAAFDAAGCVSAWNPAMAALTARDEHDVDGAMVGDLLPFLREGEEVRVLLEALAGAPTRLTDVYTKHPFTGEEVWLDVTVTPVRTEEGKTMGGLLVARDVTEHKRIADVILAGKLAAEEASRAKSGFLARMSHELRTPLNAVIGFTNVLRRNRHGRMQQDDLTYLERITANGKHLLGVIDEVLDLAKIESGRETITNAPVQVDALVRDTVNDLGVRASGASVRLDAEIPQGLAELVTDGPKLKQVLINLIGNAIKFTPASGRVVVRIIADRETMHPIIVEVEDTGIGIPPSRMKAIFEAFEQAEDQTSRRFGGTGLGLAISRKLCELMGHELTVDSEEGKGSTFRIFLHDARVTSVDA